LLVVREGDEHKRQQDVSTHESNTAKERGDREVKVSERRAKTTSYPMSTSLTIQTNFYHALRVGCDAAAQTQEHKRGTQERGRSTAHHNHG
jgi:hypothetical protein